MPGMDGQSRFLPERVSGALKNLAWRALGLGMFVFGALAIFGAIFYNSYLAGWAVSSTFGNHGILGWFVGFVRYVVGFIPMMFLFLCLMRAGVYFMGGRDDDATPEYNLLRGFIALCLGCAGLGMLIPGSSFGGMLGAIASGDIGSLSGNWQILFGLLSFAGFLLMAGILLNIKWAYVVRVARLMWGSIRWVLSAFHIWPMRDEEAGEEGRKERAS